MMHGQKNIKPCAEFTRMGKNINSPIEVARNVIVLLDLKWWQNLILMGKFTFCKPTSHFIILLKFWNIAVFSLKNCIHFMFLAFKK